MRDRISKILEYWFIQEGALFAIFCSHDLVENDKIECPVRTGKGRIEYNPVLLSEMSDEALEQALRTEAIRILLKHPYERKPDQCCQQAIAVGSNVTIGDNYQFGSFRIETPSLFSLQKGMPYEWYARKIQSLLSGQNNDASGQGSEESQNENKHTGARQTPLQKEELEQWFSAKEGANQDLSELWEEDDLQIAKINGIIDSVKNWGTLSGQFEEKIKASTKSKINWRNVVSGFRSSIISSKKVLTRMKPSRRYGFEKMGSKRDFSTKLLIAIDVSGSISSESLSYFWGIVNSAFRYGFEALDVITFDYGITKIQSIKGKQKEVSVIGRGGTSFQEPVNFAHKNGYDGVLILTDGYAAKPTIPEGMKTKILWVCESKNTYTRHHSWMEESGRVCTIELR